MTMQNKRKLAVALIMMCTAFAAQAAGYNWLSDIGSGNWDDPAKWNPNGVPGVSDTASFTYSQTNPFTVSFTNDSISSLSLGTANIALPVRVTFDLNGHTLTHTNGTLNADKALDWTLLNGELRSDAKAALAIGVNQFDYVPKVTIGAGATYTHNGTTFVSIGYRCAGELVIQDGGQLITEVEVVDNKESSLRVGYSTTSGYTNYTARMTVTGVGSVWSNRSAIIYLATHKMATAELNVTDHGLVVNTGSGFVLSSQPGANSSLNITSGGVVDNRLGTSYMGIGYNGTGTVTVTGSGSKLLLPDNESFYFANVTYTSQGTLIIEDEGLVEKMGGNQSINMGARSNTVGRLIVRDSGLFRWAGTGTLNMGGPEEMRQGLTTIESGGQVELSEGEVKVFPDSTLRIDGGRMQSARLDLKTGAVFNAVLGQGDANGTALADASGMVYIRNTTLVVEKGADFVAAPRDVYTLIAAGSLNSIENRFFYEGSLLQDGDLIKVESTTFKVGYTSNAVTLTVRNNGTVLHVL